MLLLLSVVVGLEKREKKRNKTNARKGRRGRRRSTGGVQEEYAITRSNLFYHRTRPRCR